MSITSINNALFLTAALLAVTLTVPFLMLFRLIRKSKGSLVRIIGALLAAFLALVPVSVLSVVAKQLGGEGMTATFVHPGLPLLVSPTLVAVIAAILLFKRGASGHSA